MSKIRRLAGTAAVAAVAAFAAAPADAAVPFNAGTGHDPQVAVGNDGTGHVVWHTQEAEDRVAYCRVPKNGTGCDARRDFSFPNGAVASSLLHVPQVFAPAPNKVVVIGSCSMCGTPAGATKRIFRWISSDNGATFDGPIQVATGLAPSGQGAYIDAPFNVFVGIEFGAVIAGPTPPTTSRIDPLPVSYDSASVVRVPGHNQLVAASSSFHTTAYSVFSGTPTPSNINNVANWSGHRPPPGGPVDDRESALGAGGGGTFLVYARFIPGDPRAIIHKYDAASRTFGAPAEIEGPGAIDDSSLHYPDIAVDAGGPHVIWRSLHDGGRLRYRRSSDGGATWGPVLNIALRDHFYDPEIAVAPGGSGFATWGGAGSTVRVVALDPQPEPTTTHAGPVRREREPDRGGADTPAAPTAVYSGPLRRIRMSDRGARYTLALPRDCLVPRQAFKVRLKWKRLKRAGNPFVRVRRVAFRLGDGRVKFDRKAPFVRTFRVPASRPPGSTVKLRARAFARVARGTVLTRTVRATVRVCR